MVEWILLKGQNWLVDNQGRKLDGCCGEKKLASDYEFPLQSMFDPPEDLSDFIKVEKVWGERRKTKRKKKTR